MCEGEKRTMARVLNRRQFLRSSLLLGTGLAAAACVPAEQQPAAPQAAPTAAAGLPEATTAPAAAPGPGPGGPVTLRFWFMAQGPEFDAMMRQIVSEFEESHSNISFELDTAAVNDLRTRLRPIFTEGGVGPDILTEGAVQTSTYANMPFGFMDISDRLEAANMFDVTPAASWAPIRFQDGYYGMPYNAFVFFLTYNKNLYSAAGIDRPPETWDELAENCRTIMDPDRDQWGWIGFVNRFASWPLEQMWYNSGVGYFEGSEDFDSFDITRPLTINTEPAVRAVEFYKELSETAPGGVQGNFNVGTNDADAAFARGNIAHLFTHSVHHPLIQAANPEFVPERDFGVALFPRGPVRQGAMFSTSVMGITKLCQEPDAAWEFVKYFSDNWEGRLAPVVGTVPVRMDVDVEENATGSWLLPPGREALALETSFSQAFFPQLDAVRDPLANNIQAYFLDQKTAQQAMDDAAAEARASLG